MPVDLVLESGASAYADPLHALTDLLFGARFISYRDVDGFLDQISGAEIGLIVWPGGTLAETRDDRYGFEHDGLYDPLTGKPGLDEMMAIAVDQGAALSVVLPTFRYADDPEAARIEIREFLGELLGGGYGALPDRMILEIGSEYYAHFGAGGAAEYGAVAEIMVSEIALALADPSVNLVGADLTIAVQSGKTLEEDALIRAALSDLSLSETDMIVHHRFAYEPQGIDPKIGLVEAIRDAWAADAGDAPELFVSAWNTVSLVREEVLADYAAETGTDPASVDLALRSDVGFETYWQERLDAASYGQEHATYLLESFASYAEAGMAAGAIYGVDLVHPGRLSYEGTDGQDYTFVGGEMLRMIYESVGGTHVLASDRAYDPADPVTVYGFENADKLVVFLAAGDVAPGEVTLDLDGLGSVYRSLSAESLTSAVPEDWMAVFGIPDNALVDESAEGETFALGVRAGLTAEVTGGAVTVSLDEAHEVVRLAFAKTDAGAAEIAGWSLGAPVDLAEAVLPDSGQPGYLPDETDGGADGLATAELIADAAGFGGGAAFLLAALFFFL